MIEIRFCGLYFRPSKLYLPFCAGMLLQFGLFSGLMGLLIFGPIFPVFVDFFIGVVGYLLLVTSIWQAVFGEWKLSRTTNIVIQVVAILGLLLSIYVVIYIKIHGIPSSETPHYRTY